MTPTSRVTSLVAALALVVGCGLSDKFTGAVRSVDMSMTPPSGAQADMAASIVGDMAKDATADLATADLARTDLARTPPPPHDMALSCGYAGEPCCTGPFASCTVGLACISSTCAVNDLWLGGSYVASDFSSHPVTFHYDGTTFTQGPQIGSGTTVFGLWGDAPNDYAMVTNAALFRIDTNLWDQCGVTSCGTPTSPGQIQSIFGFGPSDTWVGGSGGIFHCTSSTCTSTGILVGSNLWGLSSTDLWAAGAGIAISHWNGSAWRTDKTILARAMWGSASDDVWEGGSDLRRWNGSAWSQPYGVDGVAVPGLILSMSGSAIDDVWGVGYDSGNNGFTVHFDGTAWKRVAISGTAGQLQSVWSASKKEAYAVSFSSPHLYRWDGLQWNDIAIPAAELPQSSTSLHTVFGSARAHP
jgi:hypothetical protein